MKPSDINFFKYIDLCCIFTLYHKVRKKYSVKFKNKMKMRYFIGAIITIVILSLSILSVLALWGVTPLSWIFIRNVMISITVFCATVFLLAGCYYLFFKNYRKSGSQHKDGGRINPID